MLEPAPRQPVWTSLTRGFQTPWATWCRLKTSIVIHKVGLNDLQMAFQSKFFYDSVIPISYVNASLISEKQQGTFILMGFGMFPLSRLRHHYVLLQPKTSCTVSGQENRQPACCTQSRRALQQTASLPSRNSATEQEVTSHLRAPFQEIFIPKLRFHLHFCRNFWNYFMMDWKLHTFQKITALYCCSCSQRLQWKTAVIHCVMNSTSSSDRINTLPVSKKPKPACLM